MFPCLLTVFLAFMQTAVSPVPDSPAAAVKPQQSITIPAGTKVPLVLKHALSTKSARPGDGVYLETNFPVTIDNNIVIPPGTYVQGAVTHVKRPGRVSGRAELLLHFTTLIFPNGYTVSMPGALESVPGAQTENIKDKEGTIQANGQKGRDVGTVAGTAASGAAVGGISSGAKGAGIGGGIGGAAGLAIAMLTRGSDVRLEPGSTVEMVFQRSLVLDSERLRAPKK